MSESIPFTKFDQCVFAVLAKLVDDSYAQANWAMVSHSLYTALAEDELAARIAKNSQKGAYIPPPSDKGYLEVVDEGSGCIIPLPDDAKNL